MSPALGTLRAVAAWSLLFVTAACSTGGGGSSSPDRGVLPPAYAGPGADAEPFPNWPFPPVLYSEDAAELDGVLLSLSDYRSAGAGVTGAMRVVVEIPGREGEVPFKLKRFPDDLDSWNNSPRKELAAFALQRLVFDHADFVVPTTWPRCVPFERWYAVFEEGEPSIEGTDCVLVMLALWLENVKVTPSNPYNEKRFRNDGAYAYYLANLNLFTYLIDHRDSRRGNFLVSKTRERPQFFSIDNGIAFNPWIINPLVRNWHRIRVPALRRESIERLRALDRADLDYLAVSAQLEPDDEGILRLVPPGAPEQPDRGVSVNETTKTLQMGLTNSEIDKIWSRIQALLARVDEGSIPLF